MEMRVCTYTQGTLVPVEILGTTFRAAISVAHAGRLQVNCYRLHADMSFACVVQ